MKYELMKVTVEINKIESAVKEISDFIIVADSVIYHVNVSKMEEYTEVWCTINTVKHIIKKKR